jgi:5'-3' exonuclease
MGVSNLFSVKIVNNTKGSEFNGKLFNSLGIPVKFNNELLKDKIVLVDASVIIYRALLSHKHQLSEANSNYKITDHLKSIMYYVKNLRSNDIKQVWMFDQHNRTSIKHGNNENRILLYEKLEESKHFLLVLGIPTITCGDNCEAEQLASYMIKMKWADYVLSTDSDVLMFGGNLLRLVLVKEEGKKNQTHYELYNIDRILRALNLDLKEFQSMCVSLGTDFNKRYPMCGPMTVMKKFKDIAFNPQMGNTLSFISQTPSLLDVKINPGEYTYRSLMFFMNAHNIHNPISSFTYFSDIYTPSE